VRIRQLIDGKAFDLPVNHVIAEDNPAGRYREHVRAVVKEAVANKSIKKDRFQNFAEYLEQYLIHAEKNHLKFRIEGAVNFIIVAILEMEHDSLWSTYQTFWQDVCWFCSQLGIDAPSEGLVRSRVVSFKEYISPNLSVAEAAEEVGEDDDS
jgi:hypothetical protein